MTGSPSALTSRAETLRLSFDRSFAEPVCFDTPSRRDLIAIRSGTETCAIQLSEISGLFVDKKVTYVPGNMSALLGIAGFRRAIVPVYNLTTLLGHDSADIPRWLVTLAKAPIALAFDSFEGHLRIDTCAQDSQSGDGSGRQFVREIVRTQDGVRSILDLDAVLNAINDENSQGLSKGN